MQDVKHHNPIKNMKFWQKC